MGDPELEQTSVLNLLFSHTETWKVYGIYRNAVPRSGVFEDHQNNFAEKLLLREMENSRLLTSLRISLLGLCPCFVLRACWAHWQTRSHRTKRKELFQKAAL